MKSKELSWDEQFSAAKEYVLMLLSYRPRAIKEVSRRLIQKGYGRDIADRVVSFLEEYNYLDDEAFARMWIRNRMTCKPSGRRRIFEELVEKGVHKDVIVLCLEDLTEESEEKMAMVLAQKKYLRSGYFGKRLEGYLLRRGFSLNIIRRVIAIIEKQTMD